MQGLLGPALGGDISSGYQHYPRQQGSCDSTPGRSVRNGKEGPVIQTALQAQFSNARHLLSVNLGSKWHTPFSKSLGDHLLWLCLKKGRRTARGAGSRGRAHTALTWPVAL